MHYAEHCFNISREFHEIDRPYEKNNFGSNIL